MIKDQLEASDKYFLDNHLGKIPIITKDDSKEQKALKVAYIKAKLDRYHRNKKNSDILKK